MPADNIWGAWNLVNDLVRPVRDPAADAARPAPAAPLSAPAPPSKVRAPVAPTPMAAPPTPAPTAATEPTHITPVHQAIVPTMVLNMFGLQGIMTVAQFIQAQYTARSILFANNMSVLYVIYRRSLP